MPKSNRLFTTPSNAYTLLDSAGNVVLLPFSSLLLFSRHCANRNIISFRRYSFAPSYRAQNQSTCRQPRPSNDCSFDVVFSDVSESEVSMIEAESILILREIFEELSPIINCSPILKLNHLVFVNAIYDAALETIDGNKINILDTSIRYEVFKLISQRARSSWGSIKTQLVEKCGLDVRSADLLCKFFSISGSAQSVVETLTLKFPSNEKIKMACSNLLSLFDYLLVYGFQPEQIVFDLSLIFHPELYSNSMIFSVGATNKDIHSTFEPLAIGGRYDELIDRFKPPFLKSDKTRAIGFHLSLEKIISMIFATGRYGILSGLESSNVALTNIVPNSFVSYNSYLSTTTHETNQRVGILLVGINGSLLKERAATALALWKEQFRVEVYFANEFGMDHLTEYCRVNACKFIVFYRKHLFLKGGKVIVRDISTNSEDETSSREIVSYFIKKIRQRKFKHQANTTLPEHSPLLHSSSKIDDLPDLSLSNEIECQIIEVTPSLRYILFRI